MNGPLQISPLILSCIISKDYSTSVSLFVLRPLNHSQLFIHQFFPFNQLPVNFLVKSASPSALCEFSPLTRIFVCTRVCVSRHGIHPIDQLFRQPSSVCALSAARTLSLSLASRSRGKKAVIRSLTSNSPHFTHSLSSVRPISVLKLDANYTRRI